MTFIVGTSFTTNNTNNVLVDGGQTKITSFYPNPATSYINFEFTKPIEKGYILQIYNFIGKKVTEVNINYNKTTISLDNYFRGIYIFQIRDKNGRVIDSGKFQVAK